MLQLELVETLEIPGLPEDKRARILRLLAAVESAHADRKPRMPRWLWGQAQIIRGEYGFAQFVDEIDYRKKLMSMTLEAQRPLVAKQIVKRCRYVIAVLHRLNVEKQNKSTFDAMAGELKELRQWIADARLLASDPLVSFAEGMALTLRHISKWDTNRSFNELIEEVEGLSVSHALEAVHVLYDNVKKGEFSLHQDFDYLYDFPPVPPEDASGDLLELLNAIFDAGDTYHRYSHAIASCKKPDLKFITSELEAAVEGRETAYTREHYRSNRPPIEQFKVWIEDGEAGYHASIGQLRLWQTRLSSSRKKLDAALQSAITGIVVPRSEYWYTKNAFGSCNQASTYHAMVNCIVAKTLLSRIDRDLKDYEVRKLWQSPEPIHNPLGFIDSVLARPAP